MWTTDIYFFCNCGEAYTRLDPAIRCRKCIRYLMEDDYPVREVSAERKGCAPVTVWRAQDTDEENQRRYRRFTYGDD